MTGKNKVVRSLAVILVAVMLVPSGLVAPASAADASGLNTSDVDRDRTVGADEYRLNASVSFTNITAGDQHTITIEPNTAGAWTPESSPVAGTDFQIEASNWSIVSANTTSAGGYEAVIEAGTGAANDVNMSATNFVVNQDGNATVTIYDDIGTLSTNSTKFSVMHSTFDISLNNSLNTSEGVTGSLTIYDEAGSSVDYYTNVSSKTVALSSGVNYQFVGRSDGYAYESVTFDSYVAGDTVNSSLSLRPTQQITIDAVNVDGTNATDGTFGVYYNGTDVDTSPPDVYGNISAGTATVTVAEGYESYTAGIAPPSTVDTYQSSDAYKFDSVANISTQTYQFQDLRTLTVNVQDSNESSVDTGTAYLYETENKTTQVTSASISNGSSELVNVTDSEYYIVVNSSGYQNAEMNISVDADSTYNATLYKTGANETSSFESESDGTTGSVSIGSGVSPIIIVGGLVIITLTGFAFVVGRE